MQTKTCSRCDTTKDIEEFNRMPRGKFGRSNICKKCDSAKVNKWRKNNPDKRQAILERFARLHPQASAESSKKYIENHHEQYIANRRTYYKNNAESLRADQRERYRSDPTRSNSATMRWRQSHIEQSKEMRRDWRRRNPEKQRLYKQNRRASLLNTDRTLTVEQWENIKSKYNHLCCYCGEPKPLTIDHWIPLSRKGTHTANNVVPACKSCNSKKRTRTGEEYFALLGKPVHRL
jgi:hypothetical protein